MIHPLDAVPHPVPAGARAFVGWPVRTLVDDLKAGIVHDLLCDDGGAVRWVDVRLARGRHVLLPVGTARADREAGLVWAAGLDLARIRALPAYRHDAAALTPEAQTALLGAYTAVLAGEAVEVGADAAPSSPGEDRRLEPRTCFGAEAA